MLGANFGQRNQNPYSDKELLKKVSDEIKVSKQGFFESLFRVCCAFGECSDICTQLVKIVSHLDT